MFTPKANPKQKRVKTMQEHEKGTLLLCNSPYGLTYSPRRAGGEQTLLYVTIQLAVASRLLAVASRDRLLSGRTIFHPKNPIFIYPNPKFDRELNL